MKTPLFGVEVPVVAHRLAQIDKGSGIAMICTFGDVTDIIWWRELDLPNRAIIGWDGRIVEEGTHEALLASGGLYARYWNRQSGGFIGVDEKEAAE